KTTELSFLILTLGKQTFFAPAKRFLSKENSKTYQCPSTTIFSSMYPSTKGLLRNLTYLSSPAADSGIVRFKLLGIVSSAVRFQPWETYLSVVLSTASRSEERRVGNAWRRLRE